MFQKQISCYSLVLHYLSYWVLVYSQSIIEHDCQLVASLIVAFCLCCLEAPQSCLVAALGEVILSQ